MKGCLFCFAFLCMFVSVCERAGEAGRKRDGGRDGER